MGGGGCKIFLIKKKRIQFWPKKDLGQGKFYLYLKNNSIAVPHYCQPPWGRGL